MGRQAIIYNHGRKAGILQKTDENQYVFQYDADYLRDPGSDPISLSLPKQPQEFRSDKLFPFFFGLLSEGVNRGMQSRLLRIDENDHFSLLLATASDDVIGSVTIHAVNV